MKRLISAIYVLCARLHMLRGDTKRFKKLQYDTTPIIKNKDIPYINDGKRSHLLDIYSIEGQTKDTPVIVDIHGGGLFYGYKELNLNFNCELVKRGFKVVSLSYTLLPSTTLRNQLQEIVKAFEFIQENSEKYELNMDNVSLVGDSAGALLAYLSTALNNSEELQNTLAITSANFPIKSLGLIAIMLDTTRTDFLEKIKYVISCKKEKKLDGIKYLFDPKTVVSIADFPKTFFNTSKQDFLSPESICLHELFEKKGVNCVLHNWDEGKEYELGHVFPVSYPLYKESIQEIDDMCNFFRN